MIGWPIYPSVSGSLNRFLATRRIKLDRRSMFDRRSPCNRFCSSDRASGPRRRSSPVRLLTPERLSCMAIAVLQSSDANNSLYILMVVNRLLKIAIATEGGRNTCVRRGLLTAVWHPQARQPQRQILPAGIAGPNQLQSFQPKARPVHAACASLRKVTSIRTPSADHATSAKSKFIARKMPLLMS